MEPDLQAQNDYNDVWEIMMEDRVWVCFTVFYCSLSVAKHFYARLIIVVHGTRPELQMENQMHFILVVVRILNSDVKADSI